MTRTIVESATKTAIIGFDQPFCVIGERINPTGRKKLAAELEAGDFSTVEADAIAQVAAGATVLDINSGAVFTNRMAEDPRYADNNFRRAAVDERADRAGAADCRCAACASIRPSPARWRRASRRPRGGPC